MPHYQPASFPHAGRFDAFQPEAPRARRDAPEALCACGCGEAVDYGCTFAPGCGEESTDDPCCSCGRLTDAATPMERAELDARADAALVAWQEHIEARGPVPFGEDDPDLGDRPMPWPATYAREQDGSRS